MATGARVGNCAIAAMMASAWVWCGMCPTPLRRTSLACGKVAAEITASTGQVALGAACHMGEWDALPMLVDTVRDRFGFWEDVAIS